MSDLMSAAFPEAGPRRPVVRWSWLGRRPYAQVWGWQRQLAAELAEGRGADRLLLCEHDPVITLGRRASAADILVDAGELARRGITSQTVERGGAATYHGPGQLVIYPILDLRRHRKDVRWLSGTLAAAAQDCLAFFGIASEVREGAATGVWTAGGKVAALGLRVERWICYHGLALNVSTDLSAFGLIVPCALPLATVDSIAARLGKAPPMAEVRAAFLNAFAARFHVALQQVDRPAFIRQRSLRRT
ncbi:MAG: lipoyl(octanoyl) transferase LipB [Anaerolineae bacterium]|nr:lipoyl(octanoyl) transferase LipB [Ardenticatenia bacterium]